MNIKAAKKQKKLHKTLGIILGILCSGILIYCGIKIITWKIDTDHTNAEISVLQEETKIDEIEEEGTIVETDEKDPEEQLYWSFVNTPFLSVDLKTLKARNPDTVGWLKLEGTNVNYPFVQTSNNKFYLYHSFSKSPNSAGWVFLDYRNSPNLTDKNSILYAHGRTDRTMFGSLRNLLSDSWRSNSNNFLIRTVTNSSSNVYQIFSVYLIKPTSDYIKISFNSNKGFESFVKTLKNRSLFDFSTSISENDKILTLSTCYDNSRRLVVHAKLIKYIEK